MKKLLVSALFIGTALAAHADDAPLSCKPAGGNGCSLTSNILVFAEGDSLYEITARITGCDSCTPLDSGGFRLFGDAYIDFGPYPPAQGCIATEAELHLPLIDEDLDLGFGGGGPSGDEATYVPKNPVQVFVPLVPNDLRTACVSSSNLDYRIPWVGLTRAEGAKTAAGGSGDPLATLVLPEPVRAELGGALQSTLNLDAVRFTQDLTLMHSQVEGPASTLRLWPEGMPFKLGPHEIEFTEYQVTFDTDSASGPPPYTSFPPRPANLTPGQIVDCNPNKPEWTTEPCTTDTVTNGGYFDHADWTPGDLVQFDNDGLTLNLELPAGRTIIYETLFPRGVWLRLEGPATIGIQDSRILDGEFGVGTGWLEIREDICGLGARERTFGLRSTIGGTPQIGLDGRLMAAVENLEPGGHAVDWGRNTAINLGCGTLYVPPLLTSDYPQKSWHESAVPTVLDRGIYAGYNYNRNRVCRDSTGVAQAKFCIVDSDCEIAEGQSCDDAGFSPLCPQPAPGVHPKWTTEIEGETKSFLISHQISTHGDREMAFVARRSGLTGVFDGGDTPFTIQPGFTLEFDTFGHAYKQSRAETYDTIVSGEVSFEWPADTSIPFEELQLCDCGNLNAGRTPEVLIENTLAYWNASFTLYSLNFSKELLQDDPDCLDPGVLACQEADTVSKTVCIEALTPVPRFEQDPVSVFAMDFDGNPGAITPLSDPRLEFDRDKQEPVQAPYTYDVEQFELNDFVQAGSPFQEDVEGGTEPYGYYDASGDLSIPYFGLTPAGIQVRTEDRDGTFYQPVDLHEEGNLLNSFITVERSIAADTVVARYKLDYFTPDSTADPFDGDDRARRGRGTLFAFAEENDFNLGSTHVASGMLITPEGIRHKAADLGPAASLRLWGAVVETAAARDQLENIIDSTHVWPYADAYSNALTKLAQPEPWNLPDPATLAEQVLAVNAMDEFIAVGHDHEKIEFNAGDPQLNPPVIGEKVVGFAQFSPEEDQIDLFRLVSNQNTDGQFYALDGSVLEVDRHVKQDKMPISSFGREETPGASPNMELPGEQSIPFPTGGGGGSLAKSGGGEETVLDGIDWDLDYDVSFIPEPSFEFISLTGSIDLTKGGLSGVGFDRLGASLGFYANGDWYFGAGLKVNFDGYGITGDILLGNTINMTPLHEIDPNVAEFLSGLTTTFNGAYIRTGLQALIFDYGCPFQVGAGMEIGGWYIGDSFGGKLRGFITGKAVCLVSIRGDMTLIGADIGDLYKLQGNFWVAGGIGDCDPGSWDTPDAVLDDNWCAACVFECGAYGTFPPEDIDLTLIGPDAECAGP